MNAFDYESQDDFKRVMCWAHVVMKIDKYIVMVSRKDYRDNIYDDITKLQKSHCTELFKFGFELFEQKWLDTGCTEVEKFVVGYFKKEWYNSNNSGWYEGLTQGEHTPSTDNALESINGKIKSIHTLRERLAVNSYLRNAYDMLRNWSKDTLSEKKFCTSYNVTAQTWKMAYDFLNSTDSLIKKFGKNSSIFVMTKKENQGLINSDYILKNYGKIKNLDFDKLFEFSEKIKIIDFNPQEWASSKCSCWFYLKNYHCYHIIALAVNQNCLTIPNRYIMVAIEPKKKPGKVAKAKKALEKQ
jgi:hypothetical protein